MPRWIDTHAHLNDEKFAGDLDAVVDRALAAGVERILVIGIDVATSRRAVELAEKYPPLLAVVGIQPNSLGEVKEGDVERIGELARHPRVAAIGETGLDRYWDVAPIELQREYFLRHLALAAERDLPVVIHCREAEADVVDALCQFRAASGGAISGVMHSFTGSDDTAARCVELGLAISFAGMVTYKKSDDLRAVAATVPDDRLLVETDSPYLSPEPVRGRRNEPAHVIHTGARLADVRGVSTGALASQTTANATRVFRLERF